MRSSVQAPPVGPSPCSAKSVRLRVHLGLLLVIAACNRNSDLGGEPLEDGFYLRVILEQAKSWPVHGNGGLNSSLS